MHCTVVSYFVYEAATPFVYAFIAWCMSYYFVVTTSSRMFSLDLERNMRSIAGRYHVGSCLVNLEKEMRGSVV